MLAWRAWTTSNVIRGVNVKGAELPNAKEGADRFYDTEAQGIFEAAAKELDLDKDADLAYFVVRPRGRVAKRAVPVRHHPTFKQSKLGGRQTTQLTVGNRKLTAVCADQQPDRRGYRRGRIEGAREVAQNARWKPGTAPTCRWGPPAGWPSAAVWTHHPLHRQPERGFLNNGAAGDQGGQRAEQAAGGDEFGPRWWPPGRHSVGRGAGGGPGWRCPIRLGRPPW